MKNCKLTFTQNGQIHEMNIECDEIKPIQLDDGSHGGLYFYTKGELVGYAHSGYILQVDK